MTPPRADRLNLRSDRKSPRTNAKDRSTSYPRPGMDVGGSADRNAKEERPGCRCPSYQTTAVPHTFVSVALTVRCNVSATFSNRQNELAVRAPAGNGQTGGRLLHCPLPRPYCRRLRANEFQTEESDLSASRRHRHPCPHMCSRTSR